MAVQGSERFGLSLPNSKTVFNQLADASKGYRYHRIQKEQESISGYHLIKPPEEWVDDSQRAFPKVMNRTLLLPLLSRCRQLLEDTAIDVNGMQINETFSNVTEDPLSSTSSASSMSTSRGSNDNAFFYILFVMVFYSLLAMTLFKGFSSDEEKKDPYEEFMSTGKQSTQKFNTGHMEEKFDFEEESNL